MAPSLPPGEARPSPKPQPIGSFPFLLLFTTATVCVLFIIWRRSEMVRTVVVHQLKTWTRQEGAVRLSEDDGPPAHSFLGDDEELEDEFGDDYEDNDNGSRRESRPFVPPVGLQSFARTPLEVTSLENVPPVPPPKDRT